LTIQNVIVVPASTICNAATPLRSMGAR
jgi:hypothetical protein